jgi:hypothetical protein
VEPFASISGSLQLAQQNWQSLTPWAKVKRSIRPDVVDNSSGFASGANADDILVDSGSLAYIESNE